MDKRNRKNPVAFHFRNKVLPERGGITVVYNPTTNKFGYAVCQRSDNYWRHDGYSRALGRSKSFNKGISMLGCSPDVPIAELRRHAASIAANAQEMFNNHTQAKVERYVESIRRLGQKAKIDVDLNPRGME